MRAGTKPIAAEFRIRYGDGFLAVKGWYTNYALGIRQNEQGKYDSVMIVTGVTLEAGFDDAETAHRFNNHVIADKKLKVGEATVPLFIERSGGFDAARILVKHARDKALRTKTPQYPKIRVKNVRKKTVRVK